jgi:hypothetical protein
MHNGKFDVLYIASTTGVRVRNLVLDTMLLLHDIDSGIQGCYSLKTAAWDWLPDLEFAGWDDLLPPLSKTKNEEEEQNEEEIEECQINYA